MCNNSVLLVVYKAVDPFGEIRKVQDIMTRKIWICVAAGTVALAVITGILALVVHTLNYKTSPNTDVWEEDDETERSYYRDDPDPTPTTPRETQGRDYYEGGGYKGMDSYYIIQDLTTEAIIAEYEYYHDIAHTYNISDLKDFDKELKHPAYTQLDYGGCGLFMFYDLILADEKIDHIESFYVEGNESTGEIEFTMKIRLHDPDKAEEVYNAFVDRYSEGSLGSEYYNMLNTFDKGVRIKVDDSHDWIVGYKRVRSKNQIFYLIHVSEDY